uniref:Putative adenylate kinase n=1 Tax=Ignisphaera aggregans TaxID=334771 RepID=A0A7C2VI88_9CREN
MKCVGISGTPGTGKTSVGKHLSAKMGIPMIELGNYVIENKLYLYFDELRNSYVIDEDKVRNSVRRLFEDIGPLIVISHYVEVLPRDILELVVVLRRDPYELISVLNARGWRTHKVAENVEAELLSVCTLNAVEELGEDMVVEVDTTSRSVSDVAEEILEIVYGEKTCLPWS